MDFFEHQQAARRSTKWLVLLFALAVISIAVAANTAVAVAARAMGAHAPGLEIWVTLGTLAVIGLGSALKMSQLAAGGGKVAQSLGAARVSPETREPALRRLVNTVEEMALASGVPVPEIYVLEGEPGINAFAAGMSPSDAAVAVTRGSLEQLTRDELQGVIAHEFSHILNGDMRLNTRLIGILNGILLIGIAGELLLRSRPRMSSSRRDGNAGAILALGAALLAIGYLGVLFGRLIKAAVSRQREFLADASAVQFTRDPAGIAGALRKIGGYTASSHLVSEKAEDVSHMLFGEGSSFVLRLLATHPPLAERIRALDAGFEPAAEGTAPQDAAPTPAGVIGLVGNPGPAQLRSAAVLLSELPGELRAAAESPRDSAAVVAALLLASDADARARQLDRVRAALGAGAEQRARVLQQALAPLADARLALLDLAFPALKLRGASELAQLAQLVDELIQADGHVAPFEWVLASLLRAHIEGFQRPSRMHVGPPVSLSERRDDLGALLASVAALGADTPSAAAAAYRAGIAALPRGEWPDYTAPDSWTAALDVALPRLDELAPRPKRHLIGALVETIWHDRALRPSEYELMRAICARLHCPCPPLARAEKLES